MMPTDRLTMRSTTFDSSVNEKMAAAEMLTTPATVVASRMEMSVESILNLFWQGPGASRSLQAARAGRYFTARPAYLPNSGRIPAKFPPNGGNRRAFAYITPWSRNQAMARAKPSLASAST
jgi:hypothetical protein